MEFSFKNQINFNSIFLIMKKLRLSFKHLLLCVKNIKCLNLSNRQVCKMKSSKNLFLFFNDFLILISIRWLTNSLSQIFGENLTFGCVLQCKSLGGLQNQNSNVEFNLFLFNLKVSMLYGQSIIKWDYSKLYIF